jgi:hypothetical protein
MAAPEVPLRGASAQVKLRNPVNTALLSLIPFYALFWWYYINKEMVELGRARGTDQLGDSPGTSVLALFPGGIIIVPALITYWRGTKRVMGASRLAGKEPLNGWIAIILYLLLAPGLWAYIQVSLNDVWRQEAEALPGHEPPPSPAPEMPPPLPQEPEQPAAPPPPEQPPPPAG